MQMKKAEMQTIFKALSEKNKDTMLRIAESVKFTQQTLEKETANPTIKRPN